MSDPRQFPFSHHRAKFQAQSFRNDREEHVRLIKALRRDFPSRSPNELSEKVARKLAEAGNPVTARSVRSWLSETATPHWRSVVGLLRIMSPESVDTLLRQESKK